LNARGHLDDPPPELVGVVQQALELHRLTGGAFDPTVAPLVDLHQLHFAAHGGPPDSGELRSVLELVGAAHLRLDAGRLRLERQGMAITLDGIGKGRVVDRMIEVLAAHGVRHALVNAGGDLRALGPHANGRPWRVGVQDPRDENRLVESIPLAGEAIATSGDYVRFLDVERRYHHTIVPATGHSPEAIASVSVRARSAMEADALATAVFVLGAAAGCRLVASLPGTECLLLLRDGSRLASSGW
jgi:thiamine biosynthesis lipoprotein